MALNALKASYAPQSARLLAQFLREAEDDPLAAEYEQSMKPSG